MLATTLLGITLATALGTGATALGLQLVLRFIGHDEERDR